MEPKNQGGDQYRTSSRGAEASRTARAQNNKIWALDKWLRCMGVEKYSYLFDNLSYDEVLRLDLCYFKEKNVPEEVRKKILDGIRRTKRLDQIFGDLKTLIMVDKELLEAISMLEFILPSERSHQQYLLGDMCVKYTETMFLVFQHLKNLREKDKTLEYQARFFTLCLRCQCEHRDMFTKDQLEAILNWRNACTRLSPTSEEY